jgi:exodeoxyribonuclease VII small subunit
MSEVSLKNVSNLSFEEAMKEFEQLVRHLEEGRTTLDQTMTSYERGIALKNHCEALLRNAKTRVDTITLNGEGEVSLTATVGE